MLNYIKLSTVVATTFVLRIRARHGCRFNDKLTHKRDHLIGKIGRVAIIKSRSMTNTVFFVHNKSLDHFTGHYLLLGIEEISPNLSRTGK